MRSVQVETRRKRFVRGNFKQNSNFETEKVKFNQTNSQTNLTIKKEKQEWMNALKHGLQDIESKTNNEKFLSKDEINTISKSVTSDQNYSDSNKTNFDKTKVSDNSQKPSNVLKNNNVN